jgi:cell division protein FtsB
MILNQQKSFSRHNRKATYKMQNHELLAQNTLLKQQNELLREENRILKAEVRAMYDE